MTPKLALEDLLRMGRSTMNWRHNRQHRYDVQISFDGTIPAHTLIEDSAQSTYQTRYGRHVRIGYLRDKNDSGGPTDPLRNQRYYFIEMFANRYTEKDDERPEKGIKELWHTVSNLRL